MSNLSIKHRQYRIKKHHISSNNVLRISNGIPSHWKCRAPTAELEFNHFIWGPIGTAGVRTWSRWVWISPYASLHAARGTTPKAQNLRSSESDWNQVSRNKLFLYFWRHFRFSWLWLGDTTTFIYWSQTNASSMFSRMQPWCICPRDLHCKWVDRLFFLCKRPRRVKRVRNDRIHATASHKERKI